ncbi:unnamed protein product [Acanthoscelides obtectus]|uniref:PiggyBac transposable element-derived protein domain-containing protein n=1 Tax=Acanthoscelides obtectus TaxID=200917 RepID=A0A9P0M9R6_ACAOB|nr:unnamed protein product [Acanthoscelides obtectus]CAK1632421.1 hypothetical protein AOBTE_LOCUS7552 [Acanthoscelides obtectus]
MTRCLQKATPTAKMEICNYLKTQLRSRRNTETMERFNGDHDYAPGSGEDSDSESETEEVEGDENGNVQESEEALDSTGLWYEDVKPMRVFGFDGSKSGPANVDANTSRLDVFKKMFTEDIFDMLVTSTISTEKNLCESNRPSIRHRRMLNCRELTKQKCLNFWVLHTTGPNKGAQYKTYVQRSSCLYYHPIFSYSMSGRRFEQLLRCFSCYENADTDKDAKKNKLEKVSGLVNLERYIKEIYLQSKTQIFYLNH